MTKCKNCDTPTVSNFCPECGQKNVDLERPFAALFGEAVREALDVDGRAAKTLLTLLGRPGLLTKAFLAGQRRRYTSPVRLYLVISLLFFVLAAWVVGQGALLTEGQTLATDAAEQARLVADHLARLMFILLPLFALLLKLAFHNRLYFDHLIHSLHLHSVAYIVLALMLPIEPIADESVVALMLQLALFAYLLGSFIVSVRRVYDVSWLAASVRAAGILAGYIIIVAGVLELTGEITLPESAKLPFLTD